MNNASLIFVVLLALSIGISACGDEDENKGTLEAPSLVSPTDAETISTSNPSRWQTTLDWSDVANAEEYVWELSNTRNFTTLVKTSTVSNSQATASVDFTESTANTYYWRVAARAENYTESAFSQVFSFNVSGYDGTCSFCQLFRGQANSIGSIELPGEAPFTLSNETATVRIDEQTTLTGVDFFVDVNINRASMPDIICNNAVGSYSLATQTINFTQTFNYEGETYRMQGTANVSDPNNLLVSASIYDENNSSLVYGEITFEGS